MKRAYSSLVQRTMIQVVRIYVDNVASRSEECNRVARSLPANDAHLNDACKGSSFRNNETGIIARSRKQALPFESQTSRFSQTSTPPKVYRGK